MVKFPNERTKQLLALISINALPQNELAWRCRVSSRTIRSDIKLLNSILAPHGAQLLLERAVGYQLHIIDPIRYQKCAEQAQIRRNLPRTVTERIRYLLMYFLTARQPVKLDDLAQQWCTSRATLQNDMTKVRKWFARYQLQIDSKPRCGQKVSGGEKAIRACLTDLLIQIEHEDCQHPMLSAIISRTIVTSLYPLLSQAFTQHQVRLTDKSERYLLTYCAVVIYRVNAGCPLKTDDLPETIMTTAIACGQQISALLAEYVAVPLSEVEAAWIGVNITARQNNAAAVTAIIGNDAEYLVTYLLDYIVTHFHYRLHEDERLRTDLTAHVGAMVMRARHQIAITNPLLARIKRHYPMAFDITLAAITSWKKASCYTLSEEEIGFLVLHIGVALERHYRVDCQRHPTALLVCTTGNATARMIESTLLRHYPQLHISGVLSMREYAGLQRIEEDFVISTACTQQKNRPVAVVSLFPTDYQLEQVGKLVFIDRVQPYILDKYFRSAHFMVLTQALDRATLLRTVCQHLQQQDYIDENFHCAVEEREAIISTLSEEGIALPHSVGLLAKKSSIFTILAPQGVEWGDETAYVIFLLAISKQDYEEMMAIYDFFATLIRKRAVIGLRDCQDFSHFKARVLAYL